MARRKRELASKLNQGPEQREAARPGWRDTIRAGVQAQVAAEEEAAEARRQEEEAAGAAQAPGRTSRLKRKTYLLTPELIERVAALAEAEQVGINELVRYLLRSALHQVESDEMEIPTRPATREIVQR